MSQLTVKGGWGFSNIGTGYIGCYGYCFSLSFKGQNVVFIFRSNILMILIFIQFHKL